MITGLGHLSIVVPSLEAAARELGDGTQKNVHGERIAFVHPRDFLGALVELEERTTW
jgi:hypothetical protein